MTNDERSGFGILKWAVSAEPLGTINALQIAVSTPGSLSKSSET